MLKNAPVCPTIPVTDLDRAKAFYQDRLGLVPADKSTDDGLLFEAGDKSVLYLYQRGPSKADHTLAGFSVKNIEEEIDELSAKGVKFEHYDTEGLKTDEKGIATMGDTKAAWFKDPDGNILGIVQR